MGVSRRKEIARRRIEIGRDPKEPVAFIENGTTERQRVGRRRSQREGKNL